MHLIWTESALYTVVPLYLIIRSENNRLIFNQEDQSPKDMLYLLICPMAIPYHISMAERIRKSVPIYYMKSAVAKFI